MRKITSRIIFISGIGVLGATTSLMAQGCKTYPYRDGIDPDLAVQQKYVATASASVSFDDIDAVNDARDEATMSAKAKLSQFLTEEIQNDQAVAHLVNESKAMKGAGKENARNEAIKRIKSLRNSSQGLLRGVMTIGDCYTAGTEVRVTVGVKPETIQAAGALADGMGSSISAQPTPGSKSTSNTAARTKESEAQRSGTKQPLTKVDEWSNTDNLKKF